MNANMLLYGFYDWLVGNGQELSKGQGMWGAWHISLIVILFCWLIAEIFLFSKYKKVSRLVCKILCIFMISSRLLRMAILIISGTQPFLQAMPWQLCHILAIVLPIFYLTGTKKFFLPIVTFAFFGGILTFIFGDYYVYNVFSFMDIESIILHFMLPTIAIGCLVDGYFEIKLKDIWQIFAFILPLACYAEFGNTIMPGMNFMYIRQNGLTFNLFGSASHIFTYIVLLLLLVPLFVFAFWGLAKLLNKINKNDKVQILSDDKTQQVIVDTDNQKEQING